MLKSKSNAVRRKGAKSLEQWIGPDLGDPNYQFGQKFTEFASTVSGVDRGLEHVEHVEQESEPATHASATDQPTPPPPNRGFAGGSHQEHPKFEPMPWREKLAVAPLDIRERWGHRANELEDQGHHWREAEKIAFDEIEGKETPPVPDPWPMTATGPSLEGNKPTIRLSLSDWLDRKIEAGQRKVSALIHGAASEGLLKLDGSGKPIAGPLFRAADKLGLAMETGAEGKVWRAKESVLF